MATIVNTSKHISLVRSSIPKLDSDDPAVDGRAWFCVELTNGDFIFHVEKKKGGSPSRFKNGTAISKYLTKLGVLDAKYKSDGADIKKLEDGKIAGGMLWRQAGDLKMSCDLKAKGGGKSTLKAVLQKTKKLGLEAATVSIVKGATSSDESGSQTDLSSVDEIPDLKKWIKLHIKSSKELEKLIEIKTPTAEHVSLYEDFSRHVDKYDSKISKRFLKTFKKKSSSNSAIFDDVIAKLSGQPKSIDFFKQQRNEIKEKFDAIIAESDAASVAAASSSGSAEAADEGTQQSIRIAELAETLSMSDSKLRGFPEAAELDFNFTESLFATFSPKDIKQLFKAVGGGDWKRLISQLKTMES